MARFENDSLVVTSEPPTRRRKRHSRWGEILDQVRQTPGEWKRVTEPLTKANAQQVASDIRNAHRRDPDKRFTGIQEGEVWETQWAEMGGDYYVWLRLMPSKNGKS